MENEIDYYDMPTTPEEQEIHWGSWKKKFAITPKILPNGKVWFKTYYERKGYNMYAIYTQRGSFFDVIKGEHDEHV